MKPLERFYDYFGAHRIPDGEIHERHRAMQRVVILALLVLWVQAGSSFGYLNVGRHNLQILLGYSAAFLALSLAYLAFLHMGRTRATGFQYAFLLIDPIAAPLFFFAEPEVFAWMSMLNIAFVARCGWRFGLRTFWLEWWCALASGAILFLIFGGSRYGLALQYFAIMMAGLYLFMPMVRMQQKSTEVLLAQAAITAKEQSLRAKNEFLSKVGHELRSPLQAILSTLDLFELRSSGSAEASMVSQIRRSARTLSTHLFDLLTLARSDAGRLTLRPRQADIAIQFKETIAEARAIAAIKGLSLTLDTPARLAVVVDSVRVDQILENLLNNAIKYTNRGSVAVTLSPYDPDRRSFCFEVADTGIGIAARDLARIFVPFERGAAVESSKESAGIGLAVVQTLVKHLGGEISVKSDLGVGSVFRIDIPAVEAPASQLGGVKRVLLVDDDMEVLSGLTLVVRELGYEADTALTTAIATNLLAAEQYDSVIFDMDMPDKSGAILAQEIRDREGPNRSARFIAITAGEDTEAGQAPPFDDFVHKPVSARTLERLLRPQLAGNGSNAASSIESTLEARAGLSRL